MKNICIGDKFQIQCYKHNGKIHRAWDEAIVLDIKKDYIVFGNFKTKLKDLVSNIDKQTKETVANANEVVKVTLQNE